MEASELTEQSEKEQIPVAKMGIWDSRVKQYIRHNKLTVSGVEEEVSKEQMEKQKNQIGAHCFEIDVDVDSDPGTGQFKFDNELFEVLNDQQVYRDLVELEKELGNSQSENKN